MAIQPNSDAALEVTDHAEYMLFLKDAPIDEFAEYLGVELDLAVQLRIDNAVDTAMRKMEQNHPQIEVTAKPITPVKNLVGFATVKFNNAFVVEDLKILQGSKGLFVGMPSKPDSKSETGYRDTAKPITAEFRNELTGAVIKAYRAAVEKLKTQAAAITPPETQAKKPRNQQSIQNALAEGTKLAAKNNAALPAPVNAQNTERG